MFATRTMCFVSAVKSMMKYYLIKVVTLLDAVHSLPSPWGPNPHANNDVSLPLSTSLFKVITVTYREDGESESHPLIRQPVSRTPKVWKKLVGIHMRSALMSRKPFFLSSPLMMKVCVRVKAGAFRILSPFPLFVLTSAQLKPVFLFRTSSLTQEIRHWVSNWGYFGSFLAN